MTPVYLDKSQLKVGICLVLKDADNRILLGKRKDILGEGTWGLPGGHQKIGESLFECAKRELLAQIGIKIKDMSIIGVSEVLHTGLNYQLVELGYESNAWEGIFELKQHKYYDEWQFFNINQLPDELFEPHIPIIKKISPKEPTLLSYIQPDFKIAVATFVENSQGELLMGLRKDDFDKGHWAVPGGHLDVGEKLEECALRELEEETGIKANHAIQFAHVEQPVTISNKHYLHFGYLVRGLNNEHPHIGEPEDIECWEWFPIEKIPNLIAPSQREMIIKYLKVKNISLSQKIIH